MFELPAGLSFIADSLIIFLYLNSPWLYLSQESSTHITVYDLNPLNSVFLFIILAGLLRLLLEFKKI
jgi:hypothetical protein